jgi:hypothetical protein
VAVGDFDGDGKLDLAVANHFGNGTVSVLLGNGDGTFQPPVPYAAGRNPFAVAVGDFDGDGNQDIVVANEGDFPLPGSVSVLLGNGDGTFRAATNYVPGQRPTSVAVGDFNGDGILDLAVANQGPPALGLYVLFGNGDGTFQPPTLIGTNAGPLVVADFNNDGRPDLAVADQYRGTASVFLANGDGSFQPARNYVAGLSAMFVAAGDFNGDGFSDLAVTNGESAGNLSILFNAGDWPVSPGGAGARRRPSAPAAADFPATRIRDLALVEPLPAAGGGQPLSSLSAAASASTETPRPRLAAADVEHFFAGPPGEGRGFALSLLSYSARKAAPAVLDELFRTDGVLLKQPLPAPL